MRRLLAVTVTLALAGAGAFVAAVPAEAVAEHVGIVVRYADGNVSAACTTVGGNGLDVLESKHSVTQGINQYSGFVLKIDGVGTARPDDTHYWSYWHSAGGGGWTYSSAGAGSYTPKAGTVEGWSYANGQSSAPRPPSYTYAALCGSLDPKPVPRRTAPRSTAPRAAPASPARPARHAAAKPAATAAPPGVAAPLATRPGAPQSPAHRAAPRRVAPAVHRGKPTRASTSRPMQSTSAPRTAASTPASRQPSAPAMSNVAGPASGSSGGGAPWPTVAALVIVVGLATTAWLLMRRRRA